MCQTEHTLTYFHTCEANYYKPHFLGKESKATEFCNLVMVMQLNQAEADTKPGRDPHLEFGSAHCPPYPQSL